MVEENRWRSHRNQLEQKSLGGESSGNEEIGKEKKVKV